MKPEWTKPVLYNQNTNVHVFPCKLDSWSLVFGYAICKAYFWTPASLLILHSSGSGLCKQVLGCPLCHWRRRPLRSSGVRSIIHREGSTPESQAALADVVSDSGGEKKLPISIAMPGDGFGRAREVQVLQRWPSAQSSSQTIPSGRTEIRVNFVCLLREIRLRSSVKWAGRHCHLQYKCYLDNITHFSSQS